MTVIPITARRKPGSGQQQRAVTPVTGSLNSPSGRTGTFAGSFRMERFTSPAGEPAVSGVFTGELRDADGSHIGVGSRRHTATVEVIPTGAGLVVRLVPVDIEMLGLNVAVDAAVIDCGDERTEGFGYAIPGPGTRSRQTSADPPVVEQAKGVIVGLAHCSPVEARSELAFVAQENDVTLLDLATAVVILASDDSDGESTDQLRTMILCRWGDLAAD